MRRFLLLTALVSLAATPVWAEIGKEDGKGMHFECVSGKLRATRGQNFNVNVVPFDETIRVCGTIVRPRQGMGFFATPAMNIAGPRCGTATPRMPYQLTTAPTNDNAVEAYARLRVWVPERTKPPCLACDITKEVKVPPMKPWCEKGDNAILNDCRPPGPPPPPMIPAAAIFNLGSANLTQDGTDATTDLKCRPAMERARRVWTEEVGILPTD